MVIELTRKGRRSQAASRPQYQSSFVQAFQRALGKIETRCVQPSAPCNHHMPHSGWERATGPHIPHEHLPLMRRASIESLWKDRNTSCSLSTASPLRTLLDERRWLQQVSQQEWCRGNARGGSDGEGVQGGEGGEARVGCASGRRFKAGVRVVDASRSQHQDAARRRPGACTWEARRGCRASGD